jgi:hypothetical protein
MKTQLLSFLLLLFVCSVDAQLKLKKESIDVGKSVLEFVIDKDITFGTLKLPVFEDDKLDLKVFAFDALTKADLKETLLDSIGGKLTWEINDNKFEFTASNGAKGSLFFCDELNKFVKIDECKESEDLNNSSYSDILQVPIPNIFMNYEERIDSPRNRYLIIDGSSVVNYKVNNAVFKRKKPKSVNLTDDFETIFEKASLDVKGTLSVFIRNFSNSKLESIKVIMNGADYSYTKGLQDVLNGVKQSQPNTSGEKAIVKPADSSIVKSENDETLNHLKNAYESISEHNAIDVNHLKALNIYKTDIEKFYGDLKGEELEYYSKIQSWNPTDLLITPYATSISDSDEISISIETTNEGESAKEVTPIGRFRTTGGLSFNIGSNLNFTGLKINDIYTEPVDVDGTEELRAKIEDSNQLSLGIGLNAEIGFRTGSLFEPTFNVGFFIPFEEEISPYIGIGPGISLKTSKVRLAFSGGIAFGKVNVLNERYNDIDLTGLNLTNADLTSDVWDTSWFFGIGINFVELTNNSKD